MTIDDPVTASAQVEGGAQSADAEAHLVCATTVHTLSDWVAAAEEEAGFKCWTSLHNLATQRRIQFSFGAFTGIRRAGIDRSWLPWLLYCDGWGDRRG